MRKLLIIPLASLLFVFFASSFGTHTTHSLPILPTCNQGMKIAQKTWQKWGPWKPNIQLNPFKSSVNTLRNHWNWIANNSETKSGPRRLEINGSNSSGTIMGQTKSTFVTPPSFKNKVTITINKYDGKASTGATICTHTQTGVMKTVQTYTFTKGKNAKVKTFVVTNARGKIISVAMKNNSVESKFKFRIKAK